MLLHEQNRGGGWHPDKNPNNTEEATEMMKKINEAYEKLNGEIANNL